MKKTTILLIAILFMVIGYAAYNATVNIYGNALLAENISDFKVYLSNLKVNGTEVSGINDTKDEFTIENFLKNDSIEYEITNASTEYDTEAYLDCETNNVWDYDYTGGEQTFTAPIAGTYKLEVWGASGGYCDFYMKNKSGYGGYSVGTVNFSLSDKVYINIGGQGDGAKYSALGGYNGGGDAGTSGISSGGGGATHIAKSSGLLSTLENKKGDILLVAGGGGGGGNTSATSGSGGGFSGTKNSNTGDPGTQTSGFVFGIGQSGLTNDTGGGGGGFYGGYTVMNSNNDYNSGAGGSGYIGNSLLTDKSMYCYNCEESTDASTKTISTTCTSSSAVSACAKSGNGYSRITYISTDSKFITDTLSIESQTNKNQVLNGIVSKKLTCKLKVNKISRTEKKKYEGQTKWTFDYTGGEQTFVAPVAGTYKLEVWGAQGGSANETYIGGYGGYSNGNVKLNVMDELYINIGSTGKNCTTATRCDGGYNGGGSALAYTQTESLAAGGGGATHIATSSGLLSTFVNNKKDLIIVAAGGGGGHYTNGSNGGVGGSAGGYTGMRPTNLLQDYTGVGRLSNPGNQSSAGCNSNGADCGSFGQGGNSAMTIYHDGAGSGGGSGYYGGSGANIGAGAGGSSYIGNSLLLEKSMYCYNCTESSEESTKTISTTCKSATPTANCAKSGNGYAHITLLSID